MKKYFLPIITICLFLTGCSAAYKTGQTPDDVYFSSNPAVVSEIVKDNKTYNDSYQSYFGDDAYLRMKVKNGGKWNTIDDQDYWYGYNNTCQCNNNWGYFNSFNSFNNPYGLNSAGFGNYYSPYSFYNPYAFNSFYNPGYYYGGYYGNNVIVIGNKNPIANGNTGRPSLSGYGNNQYDRNSNSRSRSSVQPSRQYRSVFENSNNNSTNSETTRPVRTFDNSNSNSNSNSTPASSGGGRSSSGSSSSGSTGSGRGGRGG